MGNIRRYVGTAAVLLVIAAAITLAALVPKAGAVIAAALVVLGGIIIIIAISCGNTDCGPDESADFSRVIMMVYGLAIGFIGVLMGIASAIAGWGAL